MCSPKTEEVRNEQVSNLINNTRLWGLLDDFNVFIFLGFL